MLTGVIETCLFEGCDRPTYARGVCSTCYQRLRSQGRLDEYSPKPSERPCAHCGVTFRPKTMASDVEYCSRKCFDAERTKRRRVANHYETMGCHQCGKVLLKKRSDARFCSEACGQIWHNANNRKGRIAARASLQTPCKVCGETVQPPRRSFCSEACRKASRTSDRYGLTVIELRALRDAQGDSCNICGTSDWGVKGPQIDHDHETGAVRGVLCLNCNNGLGRFQDDTARIAAAAAYLERHAVT